MLKIEDIEFGYNSNPILKGISLELKPSEIIGIVGPNGAGKSTLIRCINRILSPNKGVVLLDEKDIKKIDLMKLARNIGYIPQNTSAMFPLNVFETVLMGRRPHVSWKSSEIDIDITIKMLELLNVEEFAMKNINELSGGQKQRVIIARALAQEPNILLLDEPTSDLDIKHQLEVMKIIQDIAKNSNISVIIIMHDLNLAARYADKIIMMHKGIIFDVGTPKAVLTAKNIEKVYEVRARVINDGGFLSILPIEPI